MATKQSKMRWTAPTQYTDGSAFGEADFAGFTLYIDGAAGVSVPRGWDADGEYEMDLAAFPELIAYGEHRIGLTVVARNGSESAPAEATYMLVDERKPNSPFGLSVA